MGGDGTNIIAMTRQEYESNREALIRGAIDEDEYIRYNPETQELYLNAVCYFFRHNRSLNILNDAVIDVVAQKVREYLDYLMQEDREITIEMFNSPELHRRINSVVDLNQY